MAPSYLFEWCKMKSTLLRDSANYYDSLKEYEYIFTLGKKATLRTVRVKFPNSSYHHLAGFQYIKQDSNFKSKKMAIYNVKSRIITQEKFELNELSEKIGNRWLAILQIQRILDDNKCFYEYPDNAGPQRSKIKAKFALIANDANESLLLFLNGKTDTDMTPCSIIIEKDAKLYYAGYTRWTTLKIIRSDLHSNIQTIMYQSNTYRE